jgi:hypothetical protein
MQAQKNIGLLLIAGAIGVFIPYTILTIIFEYPLILRQDAGTVLTRFHEGGSRLILTWWAFALLGLPLLIAYIKIGQQLEQRLGFVKWATTLGVISGIVQIIGLLRWVFVVPVIAGNYVAATNPVSKEIAVNTFQVIHQLGGVLLGEHLGQLFTIVWTLLISYAFIKLQFFPKWISWLGIVSSLIYLAAQADLFATVIPGFPVWDLAGLIGSTLWLVWLLIVGVYFLRAKKLL